MNANDLKNGYAKPGRSFPTKRYCQFLHLKLDNTIIDEYKHWHRTENIWKEIPEGIRKAGILDMEIYLLNGMEFMIVETPMDFDWDAAFGRLATYERQAEWEDFMSKFQQAPTGKRSEEKWQLMERIFSLND